jgi:hypothetical protein
MRISVLPVEKWAFVQIWNVSTGVCEWEKKIEIPGLNQEPPLLALFASPTKTLVAVAHAPAGCSQVPVIPPRPITSLSAPYVGGSSTYRATRISVFGVQDEVDHTVHTILVSSIAFSSDGSHLMVQTRSGMPCIIEGRYPFLIDTESGEAVMHPWSKPRPLECHVDLCDVQQLKLQPNSSAIKSSFVSTVPKTPSIFEFLAQTPQPDDQLRLSDDRKWIIRDNKPVIRIQDMYRVTSVAVLGSCLFIGTIDSLMMSKFKESGVHAPRMVE